MENASIQRAPSPVAVTQAMLVMSATQLILVMILRIVIIMGPAHQCQMMTS